MMEANLVDRITPRRAATQAIASFSELTEGSDDEISTRLHRKTPSSNRGKKRIPLKPRSSVTRLSRATASEFSPSTSTQEPIKPRPSPRPLFKNQKQLATSPAKPPINVRDSDSDLTPVSSPICSPALKSKLLGRLPETPQRVHSHKRPASSTSSPSIRLLRRTPPAESWNVSKLGTYVWVLLDADARVLEPADVTKSNEQTKEWLWWPGKIKSQLTVTPLNVRLFGDAHPGVKNIEINAPCHMNILSLEDSVQRARFDSPTFVTTLAFTENVEGSPRKKQKHDRGDQEERWGVAVAELLQEKEDDQGSDVMPEVGTLGFSVYVSSTPLSNVSPTKSIKGTPQAKGTGRGNAKSASDAEDEFDMEILNFTREEDRWSPPPADDSLEIPGELIFARERPSSGFYWPAMILDYVLPKKRTQEGKYRVEFLDNTVLDISRKFFFTSEDDGFNTCKLGKWESATWDVLNDDENEDDEDTIDVQRSSSPLPSDPPPSSTQFIHLDIREQFVYTKNVLKALLSGEYGPAKRQHDLFIGGGLGRKSVCEDAGLRGRMDPRDVAQLQKHLIEWSLRDEKRAKPIVDETDVAEPEGWSPTDEPAVGNGFEEDLPVSNVRGGSPSPSATDATSTFSSRDLPHDSFSGYISEEAELPPMSSQPSDARMDSPALPKSSQERKINNDVQPCPIRLDPEEDTSFPRQRGCEAYEALAGVEKIDYCVNVLLPEAILQILLWRGGHRTSVELLSEKKETELHEKGEELRKERDWVYDTMRLRNLRLKQMQGMSQSSSARGSTDVRTRETASGRPKRNVAMPKSYLE